MDLQKRPNTLIKWLIDYCLTPRSISATYMTKATSIILKTYIELRDGSTKTDFNCYWKSIQTSVGRENVLAIMCLFLEIYKKGIFRAGSVALSKQLLWSTVRLSVLKSDNSHIHHAPEDRQSSSVGLSTGYHHQYPVSQYVFVNGQDAL
jgi:hypothetical protein